MESAVTEIKTLIAQRNGQSHPIDIQIDRVVASLDEKKDEELNRDYGFDRETFQARLNPLEERSNSIVRRFFRTFRACKNIVLCPSDRTDLVIKDLLYLFPPSNFHMAMEYAVMCKVNVDFAPDLQDRNRTIEMYNVIFNDHRYDSLARRASS